MKITITDNNCFYSDITPCYIDADGYIDVEVLTQAECFVGFTNIKGKEFKTKVDCGKAKIPEWFNTAQTVKTVIYVADENETKIMYLPPLGLSLLKAKDNFTMQCEPLINSEYVEDLAKIACCNFEECKGRINSLLKELTDLRANTELVREELERFKTLYDKNVEYTNQLAERLENMEKDYDLLVR